MNAPPLVLWFTGLSGAGKTTLARACESALRGGGFRAAVLDGDELRRGLCADLDFSAAGRAENMRRAGEVALLLAGCGIVPIIALISPLRAGRAQARARIEAAGVRFVEVFLDCPLEVCERRDPKGHYRRARHGELRDFTGVSAPYEPPERADLILRTGAEPLDQCVARVTAFFRESLPH